MRNLTLSLPLIVAIAACGGPSNQQVAMAKQARFTGDKATLFATAKNATEANHKLAKVDEAALGFQTVARWYTPEGIIAPGSDEDIKQVPDKSIRLTLVVRLLPDGTNWIVQVEPSMLKRQAGSPQPEKLAANDPAVPGFVNGQVDTLQFEIYTALKPYEVMAPGGMVPAGPASTEPSQTVPAPTEPSTPAPGPAPAP